MATLTTASQELFRRSPDERFATLSSLQQHCMEARERARTHWHTPSRMQPMAEGGKLYIQTDAGQVFCPTDWSFTQLCRLAEVDRGTVNQLTAETAKRVFTETWPQKAKPFQLFADDSELRAIHGVTYTRLFNNDVLDVVAEWATDFTPPQAGMNGATGLYCGEQDMFCFLIDPTGWVEMEGQAFAPGFFVWNSEVGRRTVGIQSFWFQAVCQNHIVWDATMVTEFTRKHTSNVGEALEGIRAIIEKLVTTRDERRDHFAKIIGKAMRCSLGANVEDAKLALGKYGFRRQLVEEALVIAKEQGRFTVFAFVDAMTRLAQRAEFAGDRVEMDAKAASLFALAV